MDFDSVKNKSRTMLSIIIKRTSYNAASVWIIQEWSRKYHSGWSRFVKFK